MIKKIEGGGGGKGKREGFPSKRSFLQIYVYMYYTGWPRKNATTLIVNFKNIVDETELFLFCFLVEHSFSNKMTP